MKRILIILAIALVAVSVQAQKIGHTDGQMLLLSMPEVTDINAQLEKMSTEFSNTANEMQKDYQTKMQEFEANKNTWPDAILQMKYKAIIDLEKNMSDFEQTANEEIEKKRNEMITPVIDKINKAIEEVAKKNGYSYILDSSTGVLLYHGGEDVTDLIKTHLGVPLTPATPAPTPVTPTPAPKK
jgi:outer membrane protein